MGKVEDYQLDDDSKLKKIRDFALNSDLRENLTLSIDVDKNSSHVLASDSNGYLTLADLASPEPIIQQWKAHSIEYCEQIQAWTCAFDRFRENVLYSGKFV